MSYFNSDANNVNDKNNNMSKMTHDKQIKKAPHSVPHSPEAKRRIAETQSKRYELMRTLIKRGQQNQLTEDRVKKICSEVIAEYFNNNAKLMTNKQPININL